MKNLEEILHHYTRGDKPLDETNQELKKLDCGLQLDPTRNLFSAQELAETRVGETPDEARRRSAWRTAAPWTWTWGRRRPMCTSAAGATACGVTC